MCACVGASVFRFEWMDRIGELAYSVIFFLRFCISSNNLAIAKWSTEIHFFFNSFQQQKKNSFIDHWSPWLFVGSREKYSCIHRYRYHIWMYVGIKFFKEWMDKNIEKWTKNSNTKPKAKPKAHAYMHTDRNGIDDGVEQVSTFVLSYIFCPFVNILF